MANQLKTLLVSVDAKHFHKPLAAWQLKAFVDDKGKDFVVDVLESNINEPIDKLVQDICSATLDVVGFSCYIWNIETIKKVGNLVRQLLPSVKIILGGPEVSFEQNLANYPFADTIIKGAGEEALLDILTRVKKNEKLPTTIIGNSCNFPSYPTPITPDYLKSITADKIPADKKLFYYEATRGCPFSCAFCLSSASTGVLEKPLQVVKDDIQKLLASGATTIKFIDRTFNANKTRAIELLEFIATLNTSACFHFEMSPDLFCDKLFKTIAKLPKARVQFELGIQSTNPDTLKAVGRKTDGSKAIKNITKLVDLNTMHIHLGLVAGLPFETLDTFKQAVNAVYATKLHAIQLGFLKLLKGAKLNDIDYNAIFSPFAPYEVYKTATMSLDDFAELKRVDKIIDRFYNSGGFNATIEFAITKLFKNCAFDFFNLFAIYLQEKGIATNANLNIAYYALRQFLIESNGDISQIDHHIKLDCLSFDRGGLSLPKQIERLQDKELENHHRQVHHKNTFLTVEKFPQDKKTRLFIYNTKDPITNRFNPTII